MKFNELTKEEMLELPIIQELKLKCHSVPHAEEAIEQFLSFRETDMGTM